MEDRCRICSKSEPFESVPVDSQLEDTGEAIPDMITYCTQLKVSPGDSLPQKICNDCFNNLIWAFEFKQLCHQSDALFRQMLGPDTQDEVLQITPTQVVSEVDVNSTKCTEETTTYQCCLCDQQTTEFTELQEHVQKCHQIQRRRNELRRSSDQRFVCTVCMNGFSETVQWNIHRALLRGLQHLHECSRCNEVFRTEEELATHDTVGECRQQEEEEEEVCADEVVNTPMQQDLIRRICNAEVTGVSVRINKEERDSVLMDKGAFLSRLHRNQLKNSDKEVKLFYFCETCQFRTEFDDDVQTHMDIGVCLEGFYMALVLCVKKLRGVLEFECESCDYRTRSSSNLRQHHGKYNHTGKRKTMTTRQVVQKEYPCHNCGKVLTTSKYRNQHRSSCLHAVQNTISNELKKPLRVTDRVAMYKCTGCNVSFPTEDTLATHMSVGDCTQNNAEDQQHLIRRILDAKSTNGLVRISEGVCGSVLENKEAFLEQMNQNELKNSGKRLKLFYVCEGCGIRMEMRAEIETHMEIGNCAQGFYLALGFSMIRLRSIKLLECEMCDFKTQFNTNMRIHQQRRNHVGMRQTKSTKQEIERDYPCEKCGKIYSSVASRKNHRSKCLGKAKNTIVKKVKQAILYEEQESNEDSASSPEQQLQSNSLYTAINTTVEEDNESILYDQDEDLIMEEEYLEEQEYPLPDIIMVEEYDPLETLDQGTLSAL